MFKNPYQKWWGFFVVTVIMNKYDDMSQINAARRWDVSWRLREGV